MKNLSVTTKTYILGITLIGLGLFVWATIEMNWTNLGVYVLAALGAVGQTLKVEGPNERTNYSVAWFVYGFTLIVLGLEAAIFVIVIAHLVEWIWHKYPWYIQSFNIGNHVIAVVLAGLLFGAIGQGRQSFDVVRTVGLAAANAVFVFANHLFVGLVVKLARGQSFAESGVFEFVTLSLDFSVLSLGTAAALAWANNPFVALLTSLPLILFYQALHLPALKRRMKELK